MKTLVLALVLLSTQVSAQTCYYVSETGYQKGTMENGVCTLYFKNSE